MDLPPTWKLKLAISARGRRTVIRAACLTAIVAAASYWTASRAAANGAAVFLHPAVMVTGMAASDAEEMISLTSVLRRYTRDEGKAEQIASALIREGRKDKIPPKLLLGVLLVENPWLDPSARSSVGATGLMQVMPFHRGNWGCASPSLVDIDANICHGVRVLAQNIRKSTSLHRALLGYNGCVRGSNTPDCHLYSRKVLRYADLSVAVAEGTMALSEAFNRPAARSEPRASPRRVQPQSRQRRIRGTITLPQELLVE